MNSIGMDRACLLADLVTKNLVIIRYYWHLIDIEDLLPILSW